jgi:hypothetical protein
MLQRCVEDIEAGCHGKILLLDPRWRIAQAAGIDPRQSGTIGKDRSDIPPKRARVVTRPAKQSAWHTRRLEQ